jgi:predicted dinucleotide-binding enzyme
MPTAIIGTGGLGSQVARNLVAGGETIIIGARHLDAATSFAASLGTLASATTVENAIASCDAVIPALWFDVLKELIQQNSAALAGKTVVDPSNPIRPDGKGGFVRSLPDGQSGGAIVASLAAEVLEQASRRDPRTVLFYATDDAVASRVAERLISAAGFDPLKVGGVAASIRIEAFGDLNQFGGLDVESLTSSKAEALV